MRVKIISVLLTILVLVMFIPIYADSSAFAGTGMVVSVSSETAAPGQEITVKVLAENNSGLTGYVIWLNYDTNVFTFKSAESKHNGTFFTSANNSNSRLIGTNFAFMGSKNFTEDGVLFEATFTVDKSASYDNYTFEVGYSEKNTLNYDGDKVTFDTENGSVSIIKPTFTVSNATGSAGDEVDVDVSVSGNIGFAAYLISLVYDTNNLEFVSAEDKIGNALFYHGNKTDGGYCVGKNLIFTGANNYLRNDIIISLKFKIKDNASSGSYPINISYSKPDTLDEKGKLVEFETIDGSITVTLPSVIISNLIISGNNVGFTLECSESLKNKSVILCIAYYDDKGKMVDSMLDTNKKLEAGSCNYVKATKAFNKYKVMIYDNAYIPLCCASRSL